MRCWTRSFAAAGGQDVLVAGGASAVRQFLAAGLVDEMHIVIAPVLLGNGERLFEGWDALPSAYEVTSLEQGELVLHARIGRRA